MKIRNRYIELLGLSSGNFLPKILLSVILLIAAEIDLQAQMLPHPELLKRMKSDKSLVEDSYYFRNRETFKSRGIDAPWSGISVSELNRTSAGSVFQRQFGPAASPKGDWNALVILVKFPDQPNKTGAAYFDSLLFGQQFGSLHDFYSKISYGALNLITANLPSTIGWIVAPQPYSYYAGNENGMGTYPNNSQKLVEDVIKLADPLVDFSKYDNDKNGTVDALFIIHTGTGGEMSGNKTDIWSHAWSISRAITLDGVRISRYSTEPEYWKSAGDMTMGVYAHELGHAAFGLPDLYDTDYTSNGVGDWSLMAGGSWNGSGVVGGNYPAAPDAWSRANMGFLTPQTITSDSAGFMIPKIDSVASAYRMWKPNTNSYEYFLIENRQRSGYDKYLPGSGLLIYHVDEGGDNSNEWYPGKDSAYHYRVALEQADGLWELERNSSQGDGGDAFPFNTNNTFSNTSVPSSKSYRSGPTWVSIKNITRDASIIRADFSFEVELAAPKDLSVILNSVTGMADLKWSFTDNNGGNIVFKNFNIFRDGILIDSTNVPEYTDYLASQGTFSYTVTAEYNTGESAATDPVSVHKYNCDITWSTEITAVNSEKKSAILVMGQAVTATDGIDAGLGEALITSSPSEPGTLDVKFLVPSSVSSYSLKDFRKENGDSLMNWIISINSGNNSPVTIHWNNLRMPDGKFVISNISSGTQIVPDMSKTDSCVLAAGTTGLKISYNSSVVRNIAVNKDWNLMSVPVYASDMRAASLIKEISAPAYTYEYAYNTADVLEPGRGYWIRSSSSDSISLRGGNIGLITIPVKSGWNIIGTYGKDIYSDKIKSSPEGIITSSFFEYKTGYAPASLLKSGTGYWVKANADGYIILPELNSELTRAMDSRSLTIGKTVSSSSSSNAELTISITDASGKNGTLELVRNLDNQSSLELPPVPPAGIFDLRWGSGRNTDAMDNCPGYLSINGAEYPVTVSTKGRSVKITDITGGLIVNKTLKPGESFVIDDENVEKLLVSFADVPAEFSLSQNYPNPFNPSTKIKFALAEAGLVRLAVYNMLGELVGDVVNTQMEAGSHEVSWNAGNLASGVYYYELSSGKFRASRKMVLIK